MSPEEELFYASKVEIVQRLVDLGVDVNWAHRQGGETALIWASINGHVPIAALLLQHGADANKVSTSGRANSPLHWAAAHNLEIVELLLKYGADVNRLNSYGETPLTEASHKANIPVISLLLQNGAEVNILDNQGYTPLSAAYGHKTNSKDAVKVIVQHYTDLYEKQYYSGTDPVPLIALNDIPRSSAHSSQSRGLYDGDERALGRMFTPIASSMIRQADREVIPRSRILCLLHALFETRVLNLTDDDDVSMFVKMMLSEGL